MLCGVLLRCHSLSHLKSLLATQFNERNYQNFRNSQKCACLPELEKFSKVNSLHYAKDELAVELTVEIIYQNSTRVCSLSLLPLPPHNTRHIYVYIHSKCIRIYIYIDVYTYVYVYIYVCTREHI